MKNPPSNPQLETLFTDIVVGDSELKLSAQYFESAIDLETLRSAFSPAEVLRNDPLIVRSPEGAHGVVLRFGVAVFWNASIDFTDLVCRKIRDVIGPVTLRLTVDDTCEIQLGKSEDQVNFKDIWLQKLTQEHIQIISETFGQSVALKQCEATVVQALTRAIPVVDALKTRGGLIQSGKQIVKMVGFALDVRQTILAKLTLFDPPPETRQSERLSRLHNLLYDHFDIRQRLAGLDAKLSFVSDLNTTLLNLLQNRDGHRLEWIVIILIMVEVVLSLIVFFNGSH